MWRNQVVAGVVIFGVGATAQCADLRMGSAGPRDAFKDGRVATLVEAIGREDLDTIEASARAGAEVNAVGAHQTTPLHWALTKRGIKTATIKRLLELGANPNAKDEAGNSPVTLVAGSDRPDLLDLLLAYGGDANIRQSATRSALQEAIVAQSKENILILLKHGANVNARNGDAPIGNTACLTAAANGRFDFVVLLLENGLSEDLERCARYLTNRAVPKDSPQNAWREKGLQLIRARGAKIPLPKM